MNYLIMILLLVIILILLLVIAFISAKRDILKRTITDKNIVINLLQFRLIETERLDKSKPIQPELLLD